MNQNLVYCPLCGEPYDPAENALCQECPLHPECHLICCPACGYEMVDVQKSALIRLVNTTTRRWREMMAARKSAE